MYKITVLTLLFLSILSINANLTESYFFPDSHLDIAPQTEIQEILSMSNPIFTSQNIPNHIYEKMLGNSIPFEYSDKIDISSLSYLQVSYIGFDNKTYIGELIVNSKISNDILEIFKELYDIKYPIEKIKLIDEYNADDELSMADNNTSCFCYRTIAGKNVISNHSKRNCY